MVYDAEQENILLKWELAGLKTETTKLRSLLLEDEADPPLEQDRVKEPSLVV